MLLGCSDAPRDESPKLPGTERSAGEAAPYRSGTAPRPYVGTQVTSAPSIELLCRPACPVLPRLRPGLRRAGFGDRRAPAGTFASLLSSRAAPRRRWPPLESEVHETQAVRQRVTTPPPAGPIEPRRRTDPRPSQPEAGGSSTTRPIRRAERRLHRGSSTSLCQPSATPTGLFGAGDTYRRRMADS
jgi:hypothetical protein